MDIRAVISGFAFLSTVLLIGTQSVFGANAETKSRSPGSVAEHHHPANWRFTLPKGDAVKGRDVFSKYECYYCHQVRGEDYPEPTETAPELSQMGPLHPVEFFAESIINPNAVVPKEYRNSDGTSPMTNFTDKMTLRELIDVSAYIASLKPPGPAKLVKGSGKIIAVVPEAQQIVIEHGAIKDFMDAMTMGYKVRSPSMIKGLQAGDRIEFTVDTGQRVVTKIDKLKQ